MNFFRFRVMTFRLISLVRRFYENQSGAGTRIFLGRKTRPLESADLSDLRQVSCTHQSVDVLVSLYNFRSFTRVLASSINQNSCTRTRFVFILADNDSKGLRSLTNLLDSKVQIRTLVCNERIGIYEAWNRAIRMGLRERVRFFSNLNADDLRRPGAICFQATNMEKGNWDVSYSDSIVTNRLESDWSLWQPTDRVSQVGGFSISDLLFHSRNKPHCAPMWAANIHGDVGLFSEDLFSSGDAEFWLRSLSLGKNFLYLPVPLVAYFRNPTGISTGLRSRGFSEWNQTLLRFTQSPSKSGRDHV